MTDHTFELIEDLEIESLSDEALEDIAGGGSKGKKCCSEVDCSIIIYAPPPSN